MLLNSYFFFDCFGFFTFFLWALFPLAIDMMRWNG